MVTVETYSLINQLVRFDLEHTLKSMVSIGFSTMCRTVEYARWTRADCVHFSHATMGQDDKLEGEDDANSAE